MKKEQELLNRIRKGDNEAFSLLVKDLLPSAYRTAFLVLKSKEYAEDAMQNALEGAYVSIMKNKDITNFKAWFYRVVYSRAIELYRKNNRVIHMEYEESQGNNNTAKVSTQQVVIQKENKQEMLTHIMTLRREESIPLILHFYEDLTIKDVSLVLNENVNTVKTRINRGKKKLAENLSQSRNFIQEVKANGL
ncbi:RNA polymerase sigma factor [Bacillus sp. M6-12]|uniref:RNA polymerase sigma factor n=1 Tax=Bacillus sp. M6-12 TaxID=2054166 RepID=UPI0015E0F993|nr:RNA polymerase sigma factor [Bacillus sp. M6-12]